MRRLTIISHTEHYKKTDGTIVGLGSTITEVNNLLDIFDSIVHVAMLHDSEPPSSALPYESDAIKFISLPELGGSSLFDKLKIIWNSPKVLNTVRKALIRADYFQFRAPTGMGVFVIPYLLIFSSKKGWFKYAGNWKQYNPPIAYRIQKQLLLRQRKFVTINGHWEGQPKHCITFENPCLTKNEISQGQDVIKQKKKINNNIHLCFVGRLEGAKGLGLFISAIDALNSDQKKSIARIHIVGDGSKKENYINLALKTKVSFSFYGFLSRSKVQDIYMKSHAIVLPSASEGFPKVISEAMNYGCLPIVSNVSAINHYVINNKNGFLISDLSTEGTKNAILHFLQLSITEYSQMISIQISTLQKFTYQYYNKRIEKEIL